jgi:hypothetical protein
MFLNYALGTVVFMGGNISSGNQSLCANYENFNLNHTILIQGRTHERWEGWFAKFMGGGRGDLQRCFCKSLLPPPLNAQLDQHHAAQIEVSIVFTEKLVSTWYVAFVVAYFFSVACKNQQWIFLDMRWCDDVVRWKTLVIGGSTIQDCGDRW